MNELIYIIIQTNENVKCSFKSMIRFLVKKRRKENRMYCYQRLRDLREDADLKQREIAEVLSISMQQYSLYERGNREIPFHHVITLAKFYNVSIDYIAGLTNNKKHK